jgi:hypothetical protein
MSARGLPQSYRNIDGFGSDTYSVNDKNERRWVKFHFKTMQGIKNWTNAEDEVAHDRETHQRDLFGSIERGDFPGDGRSRRGRPHARRMSPLATHTLGIRRVIAWLPMQAAAHLRHVIPEPLGQAVWPAAVPPSRTTPIVVPEVQNSPVSAPCPCTESASLIFLFEIATVMARCFAGQPVKSGAERARITEAALKCNRRDGQVAFRQ